MKKSEYIKVKKPKEEQIEYSIFIETKLQRFERENKELKKLNERLCFANQKLSDKCERYLEIILKKIEIELGIHNEQN